VPPHKTFEMMRTAMGKGAEEYAIFNVSNIREFVLGIDATAKMTWRMRGYDADAWLTEWVEARFSRQQTQIANAYKIYFNAYQIHDTQQVPFLMDGQMFGAANAALSEIGKKLKGRQIGVGPAAEELSFAIERSDVRKEADAFWQGLSDMHPSSLGRRETVKRVRAQQVGFELALLHARTAAAKLQEGDAVFLRDNLIYQAEIMERTCEWLRQLLIAHEALDLGDVKTCAQSLDAAEKAFAQIPELVEGYCTGRWQTWYRGCRKLNVSAMLRKTRDVVALAKGYR